MASLDCCIRHMKWLPCWGRHSAHDPEDCWVTNHPTAIAIVREVHSGERTLSNARAFVKSTYPNLDITVTPNYEHAILE